MKISRVAKSKLINKVIYFLKFSEKYKKYKKRYLIYIKDRNTYFRKKK